eukprot:10551018-Prorocentrum_lima.AAC.1
MHHTWEEKKKKEHFYKRIKEAIQKHPRDKVIILGDFNAEVDWIEGLMEEEDCLLYTSDAADDM